MRQWAILEATFMAQDTFECSKYWGDTAVLQRSDPPEPLHQKDLLQVPALKPNHHHPLYMGDVVLYDMSEQDIN